MSGTGIRKLVSGSGEELLGVSGGGEGFGGKLTVRLSGEEQGC